MQPPGDDHSPRIRETLAQQVTSGGQVQPTMYQICIRGCLTERLGFALDGMQFETGATETVFTGEVVDQSQLYGLLDRVRDLGLELLSVQPQPVTDATSQDFETTRIRKDT